MCRSVGTVPGLAGGGQGAIFVALGLLFQAIGAKAVGGKTDDLEDDLDHAGSSWWLLKVVPMALLLGALCGSYLTWKFMRNTKITKSIITQACFNCTWWTTMTALKVNCDSLDGAWHG